MKICRSRKSRHSIMANGGFGPVKIIQKGEKRLSIFEQGNMTIADAMALFAEGIPVTTM